MADYTTTITGMRVATIEGLPDTVIIADWNRIGTQDGQTFQLPGTTLLSPPNPDNFTPFDQLTETQVAGWVNAKEDTPTGQFPAIQDHIQYVLNQMILNAQGQAAPLPWAPPEPDPIPPVQTQP